MQPFRADRGPMTMNRNLYARLQARFPADPDGACLLLPGGAVVSYDELDRQSARCARLIVRLGLQPGDRVAAQVEKSAQAVFLYLGCLRAGCVFLPLNPTYQRGEVEHFLRDASPGLFVHRPAVRALAQELAAACGVPQIVELADDGSGVLAQLAAAEAPDFATVERGDDDLAAILYTSGTTGRAKGAMLAHGTLGANCEVLHAAWRFQPGDVLLHTLPTFHFHGLFVALNTALWNGSAILFEPRFEARRTLELLPRATVFMGVPTMYVRLLGEPGLDRTSCAGMRLFVSGSAPLLAETFEQFRARTGHTILERYGMTEGGMFTSNPYDGERRCGSVGRALPGLELRVVDTAGQPCRAGEIGHIQVRGRTVFSGYWRLPEKTGEEHTFDGFFRTGDLGRLDDDGHLAIIGRSKDLIISGGLNVYPKEIEAVIDAMPGVQESAVIGLPHPDFGEAVVAVVVREPAAAGPTAEAVAEAVRVQLAKFKVPKAVHFVDELPRNAMGKVQKNRLREALSGAAS